MPHVNNIAQSILSIIEGVDGADSHEETTEARPTLNASKIATINKEIERLQKKVHVLKHEQWLIDSGIELTRNTLTLWRGLRESFFPTQVFSQAGARSLGFSQGPLSTGLKELVDKGLVERYPFTHSDKTRYCYRLVRKYCEGEA
tara:strand:+ start:206 stop:640 length:435 start_codon:yes stop_codon:yes gene_type:complete